jgi:hypothetical protein
MPQVWRGIPDSVSNVFQHAADVGAAQGAAGPVAIPAPNGHRLLDAGGAKPADRSKYTMSWGAGRQASTAKSNPGCEQSSLKLLGDVRACQLSDGAGTAAQEPDQCYVLLAMNGRNVLAIVQMVVVLQHPCPASPVHAGQQRRITCSRVAHCAGGVLLQGLQSKVVALQLAAQRPQQVGVRGWSQTHAEPSQADF